MFSISIFSMDIDPSSGLELNPADQMIIWPDHHHDNFAQNFQARSYRCSFCKRGFSNAQALGGHMNIHRRDRAKLKEFSRENLLSLDITKSTDCEDEPADPGDSENQKKKLCEFPDDEADDDVDDQGIRDIDLISRRLPLFSEAPSGNCGGIFDKHAESKKVEMISYGDLDLELRLGPEPISDSKSKTIGLESTGKHN